METLPAKKQTTPEKITGEGADDINLKFALKALKLNPELIFHIQKVIHHRELNKNKQYELDTDNEEVSKAINSIWKNIKDVLEPSVIHPNKLQSVAELARFGYDYCEIFIKKHPNAPEVDQIKKRLQGFKDIIIQYSEENPFGKKEELAA